VSLAAGDIHMQIPMLGDRYSTPARRAIPHQWCGSQTAYRKRRLLSSHPIFLYPRQGRMVPASAEFAAPGPEFCSGIAIEGAPYFS
jgi:hypothetical protein